MATYIKSTNCTAGCLENPCCNLTEERIQTTDGPDTVTDNFDVSAQAGSNMPVVFEWNVGFSTGNARFRLLADAVEIYDTGCVGSAATPGSDTVTVPAGTATLTVEVTQECSGTWEDNFWEWYLYCA